MGDFIMEDYVIYLPVDGEFLKVNGQFFFTYDIAQEHLITYQDRMQALIDASNDKQNKANLAAKLVAAKILQKVEH